MFGNGYMDMSLHRGDLSIGSIEGNGQIYLGKATLTAGANSLSTTFSGVLHPGGPGGGNGIGSLSKNGMGTLTLTGENLYTGGTTVTSGTLVVGNPSGSGTGTGAVSITAATLGGSGIISGEVTAATLGGSGIISGEVTVATGSGTGAFLAPAHGGKKQLTLTLQSSLTLSADATYTYSFKAKRNKAKTDKVIANGVTINSGASINLSGQTEGTLKQGLVPDGAQQHECEFDRRHFRQPARRRDRECEREQPPSQLQRWLGQGPYSHGRTVVVAGVGNSGLKTQSAR